MSAEFALDPRLAGDSVPVIELPLCSVRLMNDARFAWLLLVPRRAATSEIHELDGIEQERLWREIRLASDALRAVAPCDKLNLGALGNIVRQLHVHVVARREGDAAWPGPVWGSGAAEPYAAPVRERLVAALHDRLGAAAG
ncbi:MAG: diadenosine tetraphosphate hydrolase [Lysobacterales bacterium 13-68-4]|jgi:diadenosine tetraphosphate (Ap4A) HIT family hydrolase|nr:MAG: diadenosine tetraphosphate hydrolase [Xanthomonadales bacterium 15-68-25]OZB64040.1 MAG: diadenosine tetraphosphate hydrolase [Xanthomonadales bacterium 14-68-21]OZB68639.1 MAG: diadenosine tetraphosphate hydrolase [Xanthomonadales bacterium 13-68-4]